MEKLPAQMTVIGISKPGGPDVLAPETRAVPVPGPSEILIKVAAAGVNRPDVAQRSGIGAAKLCGKPAMAKWYGDDLRRKLLQAHDRGEGSLEQLAQRFSVSAPWAWKISAQRKRSGQMERVEQRRGTVRKVTAAVEQQLREWVQAQPDLTLAELQHKLVKAEHLRVSIGRLWQVLRQMDLRLKKSRSTPANATRKRISSGDKPSSRPSAGSRRSG